MTDSVSTERAGELAHAVLYGQANPREASAAMRSLAAERDELRAFADKFYEVAGHYGALDQGVEEPALDYIAGMLAERDRLARENEELRDEIGRCNEREAAMEAEASALMRDRDRWEYVEKRGRGEQDFALMRWTLRSGATGWTTSEGPGVVNSDIEPTARAAIDAARERQP